MQKRNEDKGVIRAYHLLSSEHGLSNLRHRRLKIAQLDDLNDPFDLWALAQPDPKLRKALRGFRRDVATQFGMVCFSMTWQNPLLWSHYGDRHRGMALGFDLDRAKAKKVSYVEERPQLMKVDLAVVHDLLYTKYVDWKYEKEIRIFTSLTDIDPATSLYFAEFGDVWFPTHRELIRHFADQKLDEVPYSQRFFG